MGLAIPNYQAHNDVPVGTISPQSKGLRLKWPRTWLPWDCVLPALCEGS